MICTYRKRKDDGILIYFLLHVYACLKYTVQLQLKFQRKTTGLNDNRHGKRLKEVMRIYFWGKKRKERKDAPSEENGAVSNI